MRKILLFTLCALMVFAMTATVYAKNGKNGQSGKSNTGHLYFYEKTPIDPNPELTPWPIVEDGAWGKMKYNLSGETLDIVFNGHGLEPDECYMLIYYPDPWPGIGLICLGEGTANSDGDVHIQSSTDTEGDLPIDDDGNFEEGAKIWLILCDDLDCKTGGWSGWNPTEYLFEATWTGIGFDDTNAAPSRNSTKTTTWATIRSR